MNRIARTSGLAALALTMTLGMAACGSEDNDSTANDDMDTSATPSASDSPMDDSMEGSDDSMPAADGTFGDGCAAIPTDGAGSLKGMATEPVATAASANPLLTTLVAAVGEAGLGDTLNSAENITVFAPTDDAFAKIPEKDLNALLADKKALTAVLTHHVVGESLSPNMLAGTFTTLNNDELVIEGSDDMFTVDSEEQANVICGNIETANAKVYVIDTVLMP